MKMKINQNAVDREAERKKNEYNEQVIAFETNNDFSNRLYNKDYDYLKDQGNYYENIKSSVTIQKLLEQGTISKTVDTSYVNQQGQNIINITDNYKQGQEIGEQAKANKNYFSSIESSGADTSQNNNSLKNQQQVNSRNKKS